MTFTDMIKKSVLEGFASGNLSTTSIVVTLATAAAFGLFIYCMYRLSSRAGFYNRGFNKTLALLPLITAGIVLAMQSNLVISLGMVGALSIVRFRNAVKDPMDLVFLFWSISVGIIVGARLYELARLACLAVAVLVFVLDLIPALRAPFMLVVSAQPELDRKALLDCVAKYSKKQKIRSHNATQRGSEWIIEVDTRQDAQLMQDILALDGIVSVNLLSHDGDLRV